MKSLDISGVRFGRLTAMEITQKKIAGGQTTTRRAGTKETTGIYP